MSNNEEYIKLTDFVHIEGTSYAIQIGFSIKANLWNIYLLKNENVIAKNTFSSEKEYFPDQNVLVNWVINAIPIPLIDPHSVMEAIITAKSQVDNQKNKLIPREDTLINIDRKIKTQEIHYKQNSDILHMLRQIKKKIKDGATGLEIQKELDKYPIVYTGLFRIYDSMFERVGNKRINELIEENSMEKGKKMRIDSPLYFNELIESQLKHAVREMENIEKSLEKLRNLKNMNS